MNARFGIAAVLVCMVSACTQDADETPDPTDVAVDAAVDAAPDAAPPPMDAARPDAAPDAAGPAPCGNEDDLHPNQRREDAAPIGPGFARNDLFICPDTSDFFRFELSAGQNVTITLTADPPETDLDLVLLDADGAEVLASRGEQGQERIEFAAPADGVWFAQVTGYRDQAAFYALEVAGACRLDAHCPADQVCDRYEHRCRPFAAPACGADMQERNDRDDAATVVAPPVALQGSLCAADRDWFALQAEQGDSFSVLVSFPPGEDLDLFLIDDAGREIAAATGDQDTNPERLEVSHLPAGRYALGVRAFFPDGVADHDVAFSIEIVGRSGVCEIDRDCLADGLPVCVDGICAAVQPGAPLGGRCGSDADCDVEAELCWTGQSGGHDNVCTRRCQMDADCMALGNGAFCAAVQQGVALCFPACQSDDECSPFFTCRAGQCDLRGACRIDRDCGEGEVCTASRNGDRYCAVPQPAAQCGADAANDPNDVFDDATQIVLDGPEIGGLHICNDDDDWYQVDVPAERAGGLLSVGARFRAGVDIDVYVYDLNGNLVGAATSADQTDEVATVRYAAAGLYTIRIDQFESDRLADTDYSLRATLEDNGERCTARGGECAATDPLRMVCDEASGGCVALEGRGAVALGERCDSDDDCVAEATFCWTGDAAAGNNVCTVRCRAEGDCAAIAGTACTPVSGRLSVCLPAR